MTHNVRNRVKRVRRLLIARIQTESEIDETLRDNAEFGSSDVTTDEHA